MLPVMRTTLVANITKSLVTGVPFGSPIAKGERLSQVKRSSRRLFGRGLPNRHRTAIAPAASPNAQNDRSATRTREIKMIHMLHLVFRLDTVATS
jgi:hypothetical protein